MYVHVPFCLRKCEYCSFYSVADTDSDAAMRFAGALLGEIRMRLQTELRAGTFYAGGGTPVLMESSYWGDVFQAMRRNVILDEDAEVTIEANPATVTPVDLSELRSLGFNRLSLGVQSFEDGLLEFLGRVHRSGQAEATLTGARRAGFDNLGIDLIYGIPGQTTAMWRRDLASAVDFGVQHVSCYALTVEEGTPYCRSVEAGDSPAPDEHHIADLYYQAHDFLTESGYEHYEVSNYSLGRKWRSRHNTGYWTGRPYLGFGPSAHTFDGAGHRSWNAPDLQTYISRIESGLPPTGGFEDLTDIQKRLEVIMLGLRTTDGVNLTSIALHGSIPKPARDLMASWSSEGLCRIEEMHLLPTARGMLMADGLARDLSTALDFQ